MVDELRRRGITASALIRAALRKEFRREGAVSRVTLLESLHAKHSAPKGWPGRHVDATDRLQVAQFLRSRLRRRRLRRSA